MMENELMAEFPARTSERLKPEELRAIYDVSKIILRADDTVSALQKIIGVIRPVFIFDNIALFQIKDNDLLEPMYARAIGRGRSAEADLTWGEKIARDVISTKQIVMRHEELPGPASSRMYERLRFRYFLGLPLLMDREILGALMFIRFGGPPYTDEQIILAQFIAENVTHLLERNLLVDKIAKLEAQKQLNQLQEDFIAMISHDLRSPLGFIKGYATTLLRTDVEWDEQSRREFLTIIDEEADRLGELIDNLLDSSRLQAGTLQMERKPISIKSFLRDIVARAKAAGYKLDIYLQPDIPEVIVDIDAPRMVQVFDNLFRNADKYAAGSSVTINASLEKGSVIIKFSDTGPGIPKEHLEDIFRRFYRLPGHRQSGRGTGLGLFICRQILRAHGGEISAESVLGEGTTFTLKLPMAVG